MVPTTEAGRFIAAFFGDLQRTWAGSARYDMEPGGRFTIRLEAEQTGAVIVLQRDQGGAPEAGAHPVTGDDCGCDSDGYADPSVFRLHAQGGSASGLPEWIASAFRGVLQITAHQDGRLSGSFSAAACAELARGDNELNVALAGSFDASTAGPDARFTPFLSTTIGR